jgi:hypothetical protein
MSTLARARQRSGFQPLQALFEAPRLPTFELAGAYNGSPGFTEPRLQSNFVASLDGVAAIPHELQSKPSDRRASDRRTSHKVNERVNHEA